MEKVKKFMNHFKPSMIKKRIKSRFQYRRDMSEIYKFEGQNMKKTAILGLQTESKSKFLDEKLIDSK